MSEEQEFVITSKGVLKEYNGNEEIMVVPDGVKVIGSSIGSINTKYILIRSGLWWQTD